VQAATAALQPLPGAERPGRGPTIAISILFGPFGAIPANNAAKQARERGYSAQPYSTAFWVSWLASSAAVVLVTITVSLAFLGLLVHGNSNNSAVALPETTVSTATTPSNTAEISGQVALSEQELRDAVVANHLTVYWVGPMAGAKYSLTGTNPKLVYVKYLPGGVGIDDRNTLFRTVGTYVQKNAFSISQSTGAADRNVGFMTQDGNSGFYTKVRSTNVYVGIKGSDIQVEVFDPGARQALSLAHDQVSRLE